MISNTINEASALLGLPASSAASGTQAAADTIPAQDKIGTSATGTSAADLLHGGRRDARAEGQPQRADLRHERGLRSDRREQGRHRWTSGLTPRGLALDRHSRPSNAVAVGPGAVAKADVDAFLTAYANNLATLAATWNAAMNQGSPGAGPLHVVAG